MPTIFQTKDKSGKPHRNWRFKFIDFAGNRKTKTGLPSKVDTEKLAWKIQAEHDEIRKGLRPPPKESEKKHLLTDIVAEYLAWGESQGGHGGNPWSEVHRRMRRSRLNVWQTKLGLNFVHELCGALPRVEEALREFQNAGRAGKTLQNIAEPLAAFCDWAVKRGYLDADPLKNLQKFNVAPRTYRRAMTVAEVIRLLAVAMPARRLLYEVALASGLRANELRSLLVRDFDAQRGGFNLKSTWTKNRKSIFQPLPKSVVEKLIEAAKSLTPADRLLYVPKDVCTYFHRDLVAAEIPRVTDEGKLDFHALRTTYATFVFEVGASVKEAQTLARHSTPDLTVNVYARTRSDRLADIAEKVGALVMNGKECPTDVQQFKNGAAQNPANGEFAAACANGATAASEGSIPSLAGNDGLPQAGRQPPEGGSKPAQVGQLTGLTSVRYSDDRTLDVIAGTNAGRAGCTTVVQRIIDRLPQLSSASLSALLALANKTEAELLMRAFNSAFEIVREVLPGKRTSIARRWYIETLRAQGMLRAG